MLGEIVKELLQSVVTDVAIAAERRLPKPLRIGCWVVLGSVPIGLALWIWRSS